MAVSIRFSVTLAREGYAGHPDLQRKVEGGLEPVPGFLRWPAGGGRGPCLGNWEPGWNFHPMVSDRARLRLFRVVGARLSIAGERDMNFSIPVGEHALTIVALVVLAIGWTMVLLEQ